jgi:hypothetical protein
LLNDMITSLITEGFSAFQRVNRHLMAFVFDIA